MIQMILNSGHVTPESLTNDPQNNFTTISPLYIKQKTVNDIQIIFISCDLCDWMLSCLCLNIKIKIVRNILMATFLSPLSILPIKSDYTDLIWLVFWFVFFFYFQIFLNFHAIRHFKFIFLTFKIWIFYATTCMKLIHLLHLLSQTFFLLLLNVPPRNPVLRTDHLLLLLFSLSETTTTTPAYTNRHISQGTYQHRIEGTVHTGRWCIAEHGRFQV